MTISGVGTGEADEVEEGASVAGVALEREKEKRGKEEVEEEVGELSGEERRKESWRLDPSPPSAFVALSSLPLAPSDTPYQGGWLEIQRGSENRPQAAERARRRWPIARTRTHALVFLFF